MKNNQQAKYTLLAEFITALEAEGIKFGIEKHLKLQHLLKKLPKDTPLEDLKTLLCPVIVSSTQEQELAYDVFDRSLHRINLLLSTEKHQKKKNNYWLSLFSVLMLIFLIILGTIFLSEHSNKKEIIKTFTVNPDSVKQVCIDSLDLDFLTLPIQSVYFTNNNEKNYTSSYGDYKYDKNHCLEFKASNNIGKDSATLYLIGQQYDSLIVHFLPIIEEALPTSSSSDDFIAIEEQNFLFNFRSYTVPFDLRALAITNTRGGWEEFIYQYGLLLKTIFIFLFILLILALLLYRERKRRNLIAKIDDNNNPPHIWDFKGDNSIISVNAHFASLMKNMRQRSITNQRSLSIKKTIKATIKNGGMIDLKFTNTTMPPEYLILIESSNSGNHLANLFDYLYDYIKSNEVLIDRFFYNHDLRVCWNEKKNNISLKDLQILYPHARLVIISNGYQLLNPSTGRLAKWTKTFNLWEHKVIMSITPTINWGRRETELKKLFGLVPASLEGIDFMIQQMDLGQDADYDKWTKELSINSTFPVILEEDIVAELHLYYPPKIVKWIALCAIYPSLSWALTLTLGKFLSTQDYYLVTVQNILQLCRLDWFKEGHIPLHAREVLLNWLKHDDPSILRGARVEINNLLELNPPPTNTVAYEDYSMHKALNKWMLTTDKKIKRQLEDEISKKMEAGIDADMVVIKKMKKNTSPLSFIIPENWHAYLYTNGINRFGIKKLSKDLIWSIPFSLGVILSVIFWPLNQDSCKNTLSINIFNKINNFPSNIDGFYINQPIYTTFSSFPNQWKHLDTIYYTTSLNAIKSINNEYIETILPENVSQELQVGYAEKRTEYQKDSLLICNDLPEHFLITQQFLCNGAIMSKDYSMADSLFNVANDYYYNLSSTNSAIDSIYNAFVSNVAVDYWNRAIPFFRNTINNVGKNIEENRDSACYFFYKAYNIDSTDSQIQKAIKWCNSEAISSFSLDKRDYCINEPLIINNESIDAITYQWDFGNGESSIEESPEITYSMPGKYTIALTVEGENGKKDVQTTRIEVYNLIDFKIEATTDSVTLGQTVQFTATTSNGSINWNFGDGQIQNNAIQPTHLFTQTGTFTVVAILKTPCQESSHRIQVNVHEAPTNEASKKEALISQEQPDKNSSTLSEATEANTNQDQPFREVNEANSKNAEGMRRFRCMWRGSPATSIVIGWDQISGQDPILYYDVIDFGRQVAAYRKEHRPDRIIIAKGMNNHFVRLSGLQPNTVYYFVIKDNKGVSDRMSFKTAPASSNDRLSIIAGSDSRNNRDVRRNANQLVSKLRPHMVIFDGDMTGGDTNKEWQQWFDDWQETIGSDGRLFPIIPSRGNHESSNESITELFDIANKDAYYGLTFGGNLFRLYTLNSMIVPEGSQKIWLEGDLRANAERVTWKMVQYHQSIRPHTRKKSEKDALLTHWATLFYQYGVNLVLESDAHVVKNTYPIRPSREAGSDDGFIRDDEKGTVYIGEGGWGAPLRESNDPKSWTRSTGSFNQFKWIFVDQDKIEVRTIRTDAPQNVGEVRDRNIFEPPVGLVVWNPPAGDVLTIRNPNYPSPIKEQNPPTENGGKTDVKPNDNQTSPKEEAPNDNAPITPETPNPNDPNDWSVFPKVMPNPKGDVVLKYTLKNTCEVSMQLISPGWKKVTELHFEKQPPGNNVKNINMSRVPQGRYLLVIKGCGEVVRRYSVLKR